MQAVSVVITLAYDRQSGVPLATCRFCSYAMWHEPNYTSLAVKWRTPIGGGMGAEQKIGKI